MLNAGKKNDELKVKLVAGVKFYGVLDVTDIDKGFTSILTFDCSSVTEGARISCRYSNGTYGEQKVLEKKKCCSISNSTSYGTKNLSENPSEFGIKYIYSLIINIAAHVCQ